MIAKKRHERIMATRPEEEPFDFLAGCIDHPFIQTTGRCGGVERLKLPWHIILPCRSHKIFVIGFNWNAERSLRLLSLEGLLLGKVKDMKNIIKNIISTIMSSRDHFLLQRIMNRLGIHMLAGWIILSVVGCTFAGEGAMRGYGVQDGLEGYIPARIAILGCQFWPNVAFYHERGPMNVGEAVLQEVCARFDEFVLQGFDRQPYMKGLSPRFVSQSLAAKNLTSPQEMLQKVWAQEGGPCKACVSAPHYYKSKVMMSAAWHIWLGQVSQAVRNADALLLPMVLSLEEARYQERGIAVAERSAEIIMLLIDTASGRMIWAGGRKVHLPEKRLIQDFKIPQLEPPSWSDVGQRLFVEPVWQDFPGRKTL